MRYTGSNRQADALLHALKPLTQAFWPFQHFLDVVKPLSNLGGECIDLRLERIDLRLDPADITYKLLLRLSKIPLRCESVFKGALRHGVTIPLAGVLRKQCQESTRVDVPPMAACLGGAEGEAGSAPSRLPGVGDKRPPVSGHR